MPVAKDSAPKNQPDPKATPATSAAPKDADPALYDNTTRTSGATLEQAQTGDPDVVSSPDGVGLSAKEMQKVADAGYHDSMSGRPVDASGNFLDGTTPDQGPIPAERIVANDWPQRQGSASRVESVEAVDTEAHEIR